MAKAALIWPNHSDLAIRRTPTVWRQEYLDSMTFRRNERPLFTEIFGPLVGLKEEWLAWEERRQKAARERMIILGHEEPETR